MAIANQKTVFHDILKPLLESLGESPENLVKASFCFEIDNVVTVDITRYAIDSKKNVINPELISKRYQLMEIDG